VPVTPVTAVKIAPMARAGGGFAGSTLGRPQDDAIGISAVAKPRQTQNAFLQIVQKFVLMTDALARTSRVMAKDPLRYCARMRPDLQQPFQELLNEVL
jgi:hypothetical protein